MTALTSIDFDQDVEPFGLDAAREITARLPLQGRMVKVSGRLTGPIHAPAVLVLGGVSADRRVADDHEGRGWWSEQARPGGALDGLRLIGMDFLDHRAADTISTHDQARAALALADAAGIGRFAVIGASYGGMIGLALAQLAPQRVTRLLCISAADRASVMARAWRSIQSEILDLAARAGDPAAGVDLARRLAMTTYRTPEELEARFAAPEPGSRDADGVEAYLAARGADYARKTDPARYRVLAASMNAHQVDVSRISIPVHFLAVREDQLAPSEQIAAAAGRVEKGRLSLISSIYGHDAFLKEPEQIAACLREFLGAKSHRKGKAHGGGKPERQA